jgi:guanylate kinase
MHSGKALIISAPSGSGKTTIVKHLLKVRDDLQFSISATTRPPRNGEIDGKDYYFLSEDEFKSKIDTNELIEWEEVYPGVFYGTLQAELDRIWKDRKHVVFDVDVIGGCNLNKILGEKGLGVFVKVKDMKTLEGRLSSRGTESEHELKPRMAKVKEEMKYQDQFDITLVNDDLEQTLKEAEKLLANFLNK